MYTIEGSHFNEIKIKGSLFKTYTYQVNNLNKIKNILSKLEKEFSDASHICYAYRICDIRQLDLFYNPAIIDFSNDDGEPSGTSGKQILNILKKNNIINRTIFVIRYFGGTKLGIPGLIDAYKNSAELILKNKKYNKWVLLKKMNLQLAYDYHKITERIIGKYSGKIENSEFSEIIKLKISLPLKNIDKIKYELTEKSKGKIKIF